MNAKYDHSPTTGVSGDDFWRENRDSSYVRYGIAIILFGILLCVIGTDNDFWVPIVDSFPWNEFGFITGTIGLVIVSKNNKDINK